jgi:hypothetical protein
MGHRFHRSRHQAIGCHLPIKTHRAAQFSQQMTGQNGRLSTFAPPSSGMDRMVAYWLSGYQTHDLYSV